MQSGRGAYEQGRIEDWAVDLHADGGTDPIFLVKFSEWRHDLLGVIFRGDDTWGSEQLQILQQHTVRLESDTSKRQDRRHSEL